MIIKQLIDCPLFLVFDETLSPLDKKTKLLVKELIDNSCLKDSIIMTIEHYDNAGNTHDYLSVFNNTLLFHNNTIIAKKEFVIDENEDFCPIDLFSPFSLHYSEETCPAL